jgi:hypothetical protein
MSDDHEKGSPTHSNIEKGSVDRFPVADHEKHHATIDDPRYHFDVHDLDRVQRRLKQRHVQMYVVHILFFIPAFINDSHTIGLQYVLHSRMNLRRYHPHLHFTDRRHNRNRSLPRFRRCSRRSWPSWRADWICSRRNCGIFVRLLSPMSSHPSFPLSSFSASPFVYPVRLPVPMLPKSWQSHPF